MRERERPRDCGGEGGERTEGKGCVEMDEREVEGMAAK